MPGIAAGLSWERLLRLRAEGEAALRKNGPSPDPVLVRELRSPGSDQRCGVNLIARVPEQVCEVIVAVQEALSELEPDQYYYPALDLHLTVLEICSGVSLAEAQAIAESILAHGGDLCPGVKPLLHSPILVFDDRTCALNLLAERSSLARARKALTEQLSELGVEVRSRHPPEAAHVTLLRYTNPVTTPLDAWIQKLSTAAVPSDLTWTIDAVELSYGATWYGMRSRIHLERTFRMA